MDALIPGFVRKAALWIERNKTLNYMKKFAEISIDPNSAETPRYITLVDTGIKSVLLFRWTLDDGSYADLSLRNPRDFTKLEVGTPSSYWLDGNTRIVLSSTPDEVLSGELQVARYSSWPASDASSHWLMDYAEDILEAQAMINFGKHARDPELMAYWKAIRDEGLIGLYAADEEFAYDNSDLRMEYNGG